MARKLSRFEDEPQELNLGPMMNLVIILIPMLLLSIVFLEVGVINITAPNLSVGGPPKDTPPEPEKQPLNLTVAVSVNGFTIAATGANVPPMPGCPATGPTICLKDQNVDVAAKFEQARAMMSRGQAKEGEATLLEALSAYNVAQLYSTLVKIKTEYPQETIVNLSADGDMPFGALVRVMDVARFKLDKDAFNSNEEFWAAQIAREGNVPVELFSDPVLTVVK